MHDREHCNRCTTEQQTYSKDIQRHKGVFKALKASNVPERSQKILRSFGVPEGTRKDISQQSLTARAALRSQGDHQKCT